MKRILFIFTIVTGLAACGGGKHEPVVKDSTSANATNGTGTMGPGSGSTDSATKATNGARVNPIDTANTNKPKP